MKTSQKGLALIKKFEGCKLTAYQDSVGVWTIGYGVTSSVGYGRIQKGMAISQATADKWLVDGLAKYESAVNKAALKTNQNQFDAMVSLCWNIGQGGLMRSSVVKLHNAGDFKGAAAAFLMWSKAGGKTLPGLLNRRKAESALYLTPMAVSDPVAIEIKPVQPVSAPMAPLTMPEFKTAPVMPPEPRKGLFAVLASLFKRKQP